MIKAKWIDNTNDGCGIVTFVLCVTESGLKDGGKIASGQVSVKGGDFFLEGIFVAENRRGEGLGDFVTRLMIRKCFEHGGIVQRLTAPEKAVGFFERLDFSLVGSLYETPRGIFADMIRTGDISGNC